MAPLSLSPGLPHHQALEVAAAAALARHDFATAFRLADRRCRIPPAPEAHDYLLRADALRQLGDEPAGLCDVEHALAIAPLDVAANRRLLAWTGRARPTPAVVTAPNAPPASDIGNDVIPADARTISVIVPVYGDVDATRICLDALQGELDRVPLARAILIDDATPDPAIAAYLRAVAARADVTLLVNRRNLGFVGSVNRALRAITAGDVILLNADTVPPPGFIERLAEAAQTAPDIGTAVPFSNNAELTSFPIAGQENPLGSRAEVAALDAIAARTNDCTVVNIPSGTGFCLYVTRGCLDAVGGLSETFRRGYFEDVDFALRARALGFRAVCATSVYVGHAGSRSFGAEKSVLVAQNYVALAERFPGYAAECAAFAAADPLRPYRSAIARQAAPWPTGAVLMVSGVGVVGEVSATRAVRLSAADAPVVTLGIARDGQSAMLAAGKLVPPIYFKLQGSDLSELIATLGRMRPAAVELHDPAATPTALLAIVLDLGCPHDFLVADDGLERRLRDADPARRRAWSAAVETARALLIHTPDADAYARRVLPSGAIRKIANSAGDRAPRAPPQPGRNCRLGVISPRLSVADRTLIGEVSHAVAEQSPDVEVVVLGETPTDESLLNLGNVFISGRVSAAELPQALRRYDVSHVFTGFGRPLFGHPLVEGALSDARPVASLDWADGRAPRRSGDLSVAASQPLAAIADNISRWLVEAAA